MSTTHINTLEQLVALAANGTNNDTKYEFFSRTDVVWVDEDEGRAWAQLNNELFDQHYALPFAERHEPAVVEAYEAASKELHSIKPPQVQVTTYSLQSKSSKYSYNRGRIITMSVELGEMIDKVWTKKPAYEGATWMEYSRQGLTLAGLVKRLGVSDVADRIKAAKKAEELRLAKSRRNNIRQYAAKKAAELKALIDESPELFTASSWLDEIMNPTLED